MTTFTSNKVLEKVCAQLAESDADWGAIREVLGTVPEVGTEIVGYCAKVYVRSVLPEIQKYLSIPQFLVSNIDHRSSNKYVLSMEKTGRGRITELHPQEVEKKKQKDNIGEIISCVVADGLPSVVDIRLIKFGKHVEHLESGRKLDLADGAYFSGVISHQKRIKPAIQNLWNSQNVGCVLVVPQPFVYSEACRVEADKFRREGIVLVPFYTTIDQFRIDAVRELQKTI